MNSLFKNGFILNAALATVFIVPSVLADSLTLPTTPLIAGSNVEPNLMLLLDSSGSMDAIVEQETEDGYDADEDYYDCESENTVDEDDTVFFTFSNTTPYISFSSDSRDTYEFGNDGDNSSSTSNNDRKGDSSSSSDYTYCFDDDTTYTAYLNSSSYSGTSGSYSGNFLNWYFQYESDDAYSDGKKESSSTRIQVTQEVATDLVGDLSGIRVGLAKYNGQYGANVLVDIDDIEDNSTILADAIDEISASSVTPLGESLQDLAWYFTQGGNGKVTLHDGDDDEETCTASDAFYNNDGNRSDTITLSSTVVEYWCQQNFVVAMTDGLPTYDQGFTDKIKNYDDYDDYDDFTSSDDSDGYDLYRLNVVKAMYESDFRPDLTEDDGTAVTNNVTTYLIGFSSTSATGSSLLSNMATAGGGSEFLTADTSDELLAAFWEAADSIFAKTAAMSSLSFNTSEVSSDSALFMANFETSDWSGSLYAYELTDTDDEVWEAGELLDALSTTTSTGDFDDIYDRNMYTYNGTTGVKFAFDNLTTAQKNDLYAGADIDGDDASSDSDDAETLVNYFYGDDSNEGSGDDTYRTRSSLLGDIVNSTTVYVGAPELDWPDYTEDSKFGGNGKNYSDFVSDNEDRTPAVYVGANDGMLHGFNAEVSGDDAGQEVLAYIPGIIASADDEAGLHYLADQNYAHKFYVDLTPTVSDVYINGAWRSVLIGGLRAGGKGLFALDVTDPDDFDDSSNASDIVLWEFSSDDDADFGYSYSKPMVAMMQNGEWAVIVGNGYNNSGDGTAELFILFIDEGTDGTWSTTDYVKINTEVGSTDTPNGLSTPTVVDTDGDSVADRIYAGDLQGNMWVFDVSNDNEDNWGVAYEASSSPSPLFTATNDDGVEQPITSAPTLIENTSTTAGSPNLIVFFGTGKYLEETDISDNLDVMGYYAVLDSGVGAKDSDDLLERIIYTSDDDLRTVSGDTLTWGADNNYGWYMDLVDRDVGAGDDSYTALGERVVTASTISGDIIFFNTWIPDGSECSSGGESWYMSVDLDTGLASTTAVFDANGDGVIDDDDIGYVGEYYSDGLLSTSTISNDTQYTVDSNGDLVEREVETSSTTTEGRLSWEELYKSE
jgi:type IV pilus assembly protein PilY1